MRFLADENIPHPSVRLLREAGHEVEAVGESGARMKDSEVLARARQRGQVLVTFDRDFGDLIYHQKAPAPEGIVYLRFIPMSSDEPARLLLGLLGPEGLELTGCFTVVDRDRVRQRPLLPRA